MAKQTSVLGKPHTIAVFRALQLGDMLCTVPALRSLRSTYPESHITLIGLPWAHEFVTRFDKYLDDFVAFPGYPGLPEQKPKNSELPSFLTTVQRRHFDLLLQMQGSGTITNPLLATFGAKQTAGFYEPSAYRPNGQTYIPYPNDLHEVKKWLFLLESLGMQEGSEELAFPLFPEEERRFAVVAKKYGLYPFSYVVIHPGSRSSTRQWHVKKFGQVADFLAKQGLQLVVTGSKSEKTITQRLIQATSAPVIDLTGQTSLGELACLLAQARLLIANDTGVSHIATALRVPSVILFTGSEIARWAPLDTKLHKAVDGKTNHAETQVLGAAEELLKLKIESHNAHS